MSTDQPKPPTDSAERAADSRSGSGAAELARSGQEKPADLQTRLDEQAKLRSEGKTSSSAHLPKVFLLTDEAGQAIARVGEKSVAIDATALPLAKPETPLSAMAGHDAAPPARMGTVVAPQEPGPDLEKDAETIRKATKRDDLIDLGTDKEAIYEAMKWKTPAQTLELMKIYAKNNTGADLMDDLKDELGEKGYARVKDQLQDAKALERLTGDPEVKKEHAELERRARETMTEPELSQFLKNQDKFEGRLASLERQYQKEFEARGMSPEQAAKEAEHRATEQVEKTLQNMEKLLEKNDKAPVEEKDRILLAQQAMEHAADPKSICQGQYGTCGVASLETRTYTADPAEATRVVAEMATKGKYTGNGTPPVTVELDAESLKKQGQSNNVPHGDNERDYASQLFQVTAFNVVLEKQNQLTTPHGQIKYLQGEGVPGAKPADNGARLVDCSKVDPATGKALVLERDPGIFPQDLAMAAREISPSSSQGPVVLEHSFDGAVYRPTVRAHDIQSAFKESGIEGGKIDANDPDSFRKAHEAIDKKEGLDPNKRVELHRQINQFQADTASIEDKSVVEVKTEQEMKDTLARLKDEGKLPVAISVNTQNEPFWTDSGGGTAGGSGGGHFVTITDYDKDTGIAKMQNQWGIESSHDLSAKDLFEATMDPKLKIRLLQREVDDNRSSWFSTIDYAKEYELLRLKKNSGQISDDDYDKKLVELSLERYKKWKKDGTDSKDPAYNKETKRAMQMVETIERTDPARGQRIRDAIANGTKEIDAH